VSAECHFHNILSKLSFVSPCFIVVSVFLFIFSSAGLTAELTPEQRAKIQLLNTSTIQTPSERLNYNLGGLHSQNYGDYYYTEGKADQALNEYLDAVKKYTGTDKEPSIQFKIGLCYEALHHNNEAMDKYREILTKYPASKEISETRFHLAGYYYNQGQINEAMAYYQAIVANSGYYKAGSWLLACTYQKLGGCERNLNKGVLNDKSRECYNKAIQIAQGASDISEAQKLYLLSEQYMELQNYDKALAILNETLKKYPGNAVALYHKGYIYLQLGKPEQALADFNRILTMFAGKEEPMKTETMYCMGNYYYSIGKNDDAIAMLSPILSLSKKPDYYSSVLLLMAKIYKSKRDYSQAINYLTQIIAQPLNRQLTDAIHLEIAECYRLAGNYDSERIVLNAIIDTGTDSVLTAKAREMLELIPAPEEK